MARSPPLDRRRDNVPSRPVYPPEQVKSPFTPEQEDRIREIIKEVVVSSLSLYGDSNLSFGSSYAEIDLLFNGQTISDCSFDLPRNDRD